MSSMLKQSRVTPVVRWCGPKRGMSVGTKSDVLESGTFDRRSLIKKAALAGGAAWVAPVVLSSRAGAAFQITVCYYQNRETVPSSQNPCWGDPSDVDACDHDLIAPYYADGCDHPEITMVLDPESGSISTDGVCLIREVHVQTEKACQLLTFDPTNTVTFTKKDVGGEDMIEVGVVFCCTGGSGSV